MNKSIQRMLILILCLLLCAGLLPGRVWAAEIIKRGTCGEYLTWTLDSEGTLTISGTGEMPDYSIKYTPWYKDFVRSILTVEIRFGVTVIGDFAFSLCSNLTSVTIPNSVTGIGWGVFHGCSSLTSVTIPNSVTSIGDGTFSECSSLTSVTLPDSLTSIGVGAFADCSSLTGVTIPNSMTCIGDYVFSGCSSLRSVTIPNRVTIIGEGSFYGCNSLRSVTIPDSVTSICEYAFCNCSSLRSVRIPNGVTDIGVSAFGECGSLRSVTIPDSVTSIGHYAFYGCTSLTDVYYSGTEAQWNAITGSGKPTGNMITIHYFDADPSNPLGQSQPYIVGEEDEAAAVVNFASPADRPMTVYGVRYSAAGQLLGIDAYPLEAGQFGQLEIYFENGDYLRVFAMDADTCVPLCKNLQVDRPA